MYSGDTGPAFRLSSILGSFPYDERLLLSPRRALYSAALFLLLVVLGLSALRRTSYSAPSDLGLYDRLSQLEFLALDLALFLGFAGGLSAGKTVARISRIIDKVDKYFSTHRMQLSSTV